MKDRQLVSRLSDELTQRYGRQELEEMVADYAGLYEMADVDAQYIMEEILADAFSGIDVFGKIVARQGATRYSAQVRNSTRLVKNKPEMDGESLELDNLGHSEEGSGAGKAKEHFSLDTAFSQELDQWAGKADHTFRIGTTSQTLKSIGVQERGIIWHSKKIAKILREHAGMTRQIIKQVPYILENPILVLKSRQSDSRLVMFSEVWDEKCAPVTAILELQPTNRGDELLDLNVIASAYGKDSRPAQFTLGSDALYLDAKKENHRLVAGPLAPIALRYNQL